MIALVNFAAWSLGDYVIAAVIIAAVLAIAFIAFRAMGVSPPGWFIQMCWVVVIAVVAIVLIRLVLSL